MMLGKFTFSFVVYIYPANTVPVKARSTILPLHFTFLLSFNITHTFLRGKSIHHSPPQGKRGVVMECELGGVIGEG
jgi:hypothetical protein